MMIDFSLTTKTMSNGQSRSLAETKPGLTGRQGIQTEIFDCNCLPVMKILDAAHMMAV
jgi:hypothetical protein